MCVWAFTKCDQSGDSSGVVSAKVSLVHTQMNQLIFSWSPEDQTCE